MRHSLRGWLFISHILPLLIGVPLIGVILIYVLETQLLLPQLTRTISGNAMLIAEISQGQPEAWTSPSAAQAWLQRINPGLASQVMFLSPDCQLLASSNPAGAASAIPTAGAECQEVVQGRKTIVKSNITNKGLSTDTIDALAPVFGVNGQVIGIVRLTYPYSSVINQFFQARSIIVVLSLVEIVAGVIISTLLALRISKPIQEVTRAVSDLAHGEKQERLLIQGPNEVRLLSEAVNLLVERLNNLEQARRRLLSNLVHELGRPLGALRSANQAILEGADKDPQLSHELLVGMDDEMGRLQNLLQSLKDHYEQANGTLELDRQAIPLDKWIARLLLPWQEAARAKQLQWEVYITPALPMITADPIRLAQAFENLISNAIKYTPTGGTVSISVGRRDGKVWFQVNDTGPGISDEEQANLWDPFYRGKQGRRFPQGMGLGLSIAHDIALAHGGQLDVKSTPGVGSTFTISIPIINPNGNSNTSDHSG